MAVLDKYVNPDMQVATYKTTAAFKNAGSRNLIQVVSTFEVAAADDDGSVFRLFRVPSTCVPISLRVACDALTGSTDWDCGFYTPGVGGAVIDKDILADGVDLAAGFSRILAKDLLVTVDLADAWKMLYELPVNGTAYDVTTRPMEFDIALTANTIGSGAGTITVFGVFLNP